MRGKMKSNNQPRRGATEKAAGKPGPQLEFVDAAAHGVKALIPIALLMLIGLAAIGSILMAVSRG